MSFEAMGWAIRQKVGNTTAKFVLLMIANYSDEEGRSWPSQDHIAEAIEGSRYTVMRALDYLEERGLITRQRRHRADGSRASDIIRLDLSRKMQRCTDAEPKSQIATADTVKDTINREEARAREVVCIQEHRAKRASQVPRDFQPNDTSQKRALEEGLSPEDLPRAIAFFIDYWTGRGQPMKDWQATFRNSLPILIKQVRSTTHDRRNPPPSGAQRPQPPGSNLTSIFDTLYAAAEAADERSQVR